MEKAIQELIFPQLTYEVFCLSWNEKKGVAGVKIPLSTERRII